MTRKRGPDGWLKGGYEPMKPKSLSESYAESMVSIGRCPSADTLNVPTVPTLTPEEAKELLDKQDSLAPRISKMQGLVSHQVTPEESRLANISIGVKVLENVVVPERMVPRFPEDELAKDLSERNRKMNQKIYPSAPAVIQPNPKEIDSSHKIPVNLCPASAIIAIALVIAQGHKKPGRSIYNWRTQPISYMSYHGAAQRHLLKSIDGSDFDQELSDLAGVPVRHDWAAMSCLAIIEDARQCGTLIDDRPIKGGAEEFLESITVKPE